MKILFVSGFNPTHIGGGETWLINVVNNLKSRHSVSILSSTLGKNTSSAMDGITIHEYNLLKASRRLRLIRGNRTGAILPALRFGAMFRSDFEQADVVYAIYFPDLQFICRYFQFITDTPCILGHHNATDRLKFDQSSTARWAYRFLAPSNIRIESKLFSAHHILNQRDFDIFTENGARNIFKIPNGVDSARFPSRDKYDRFTLIFVGRLAHQKGVDLIPKVVELLNKKIPDYRMYIIGQGELQDVVKGIQSDRIIWLGYTPEEVKIQYMSQSHVLIAPSRHEAFMLTGLEALAAGTPVVAFNIPGVSDYLENSYNGFLTRSVDEFCDRIVDIYQMYKNDNYWNLVKNARTTAKKYDWSIVIPEIESMLQKVSSF